MQDFRTTPQQRKAFLLRIILGNALGQTPKEFAEQELGIMEERRKPPICPHGLPRALCARCASERNRAEWEALAAITGRTIEELAADLTAPDPREEEA